MLPQRLLLAPTVGAISQLLRARTVACPPAMARMGVGGAWPPPRPHGQPGADRTATVGRVVPKGTPAGMQGPSTPTGIAAGVPRDPPVVTLCA